LQRNAEFADPKLNLLLQGIAWETVSQHPMAGIRENATDKK
jgi:hypothetical protein